MSLEEYYSRLPFSPQSHPCLVNSFHEDDNKHKQTFSSLLEDRTILELRNKKICASDVLLMNSQRHRQALITTLEDTYVPVGTDSDNLVAMISRVTQGHRISFGSEELPFEGAMHNKALHVTIKCRDMILNRVLIDDGSGLNICPLSTLKQLNYDVGKIQQSRVNVRAFDGGRRDTLGAVSLTICMGPAEFVVELQVMDIATSYNMLLGRPWIHMAGAVPSTLYQMMKFIWHKREVIIYGEGSHSNLYAPIIDNATRGSVFSTSFYVEVTFYI